MMKKLVYSLIASLCLAGCSEELNEMPQNNLTQQGGMKTLTATVGGTESRTSLGDDGAVLWSAADAIALSNGTVSKEYTLTDGAGETSATFQATEEAVPEADTYYAYYPAEGVTDASNGTFTVTLPAIQTYTAGSFAPDALPMMAVSTTTSFAFKHVCGLLKLTLTNAGSDALSIAKVLVSADEPMSGTATVTCADDAVATLTEGEGVTVAFSEALALAAGESEVVYVALPVKTYTNAKISVITTDDKYRTFSAGSEGFAIERAKFSNVDLSLKSADIAALPEMTSNDFYAGVNNAFEEVLDDSKSLKHINFETYAEPTVLAKATTPQYEVIFDPATQTATIRIFAPYAKLTDVSNMFGGWSTPLWKSSLESIDFTGLDTSEVTNMSNMFLYCTGLKSLDLSSFDTSNVTDMSRMFNACTSLTTLDLSSFDTSKVTNMSYMFSFCNLTSLNMSSFDTSSVTNMSGMFNNYKSATPLDLSNFDTSKVTNMADMFSHMRYNTVSLDLSNFDTSSVVEMGRMFYNSTGLTSLNISSFTTNALTGTVEMFTDLPTDCAITISSALNDLVNDQLADYTNVTVQ